MPTPKFKPGQTATKKAAKPAQAKGDSLITDPKDNKSWERLHAEMGMSPITGNMFVANLYAKGTVGELDLTESHEVMRKEVKKVQDGDLSGIEATLMAQAITLDKIFIEMARRAALNVGEHMPAMETYLKLALKAQTQCRTTLQTLAEVKNPQPVSFVNQANISHGPQQINNSVSPRPEKIKNQPNELLEQTHGERLDTQAKQETSGNDTELEAWNNSTGPRTAAPPRTSCVPRRSRRSGPR